MKKKRRKLLSVGRRDLWDGARQYLIYHLSVDKLKHMQRHVANKDTRMRDKVSKVLKWRMHRRV